MNKHHIHATRLCAIWLTAASLLAMPASLRAQSYQKLWESVTQAEQTDRPRTTRNLVDKIIQKAQAENNETQWLRASLVRLKLSQSISTDSFWLDREQLAARVPQLTDSALVSIGHAMLVHSYSTARNDSASMSATRRHARLALTSFDQLYRTKAEPYADLLEEQTEPYAYGTSLLPAVAKTVMVSLRHIGDNSRPAVSVTNWRNILPGRGSAEHRCWSDSTPSTTTIPAPPKPSSCCANGRRTIATCRKTWRLIWLSPSAVRQPISRP